MSTTSLGMKIPAEWDESWYGSFVTAMGQIDSFLFASLENQMVWLSGGGDITLDSDTLEWTEDLVLVGLSNGGTITVAAGTLSNFTSGSIAYVTISRPGGGSSTVSMQSAQALSGINDINKIPLIVRVGSELVVRNRQNSSGIVTQKEIIVETASLTTSSTEDNTVSIGEESGLLCGIKIEALSNSTDVSVALYADAAKTDAIATYSNVDGYTSAYVSRETHGLIELETNGDVVVSVTNNDSESIFKVRLNVMSTPSVL